MTASRQRRRGRAARIVPVVLKPQPERDLPPMPFPLNSWVSVEGLRGQRFRVRGVNRDGSVVLYGGDRYHQGTRCIMPARCSTAHRPSWASREEA